MRSAALAAALIATSCSLASAQSPRSAAQVLPDSTMAYLEITNPAGLIDEIQTHPVAKLIEDHEQFKNLIASPEFAAAFLGKTFLENQINDTLLNAHAN